MRLQELYHTLKTAYDNWEDPQFEVAQKRQDGNNYKFKNAKKIASLLTPLVQIDGIGGEVSAIFIINMTFYKGTASIFTEEEKEQILSSTVKIKANLEAMLGMCSTLGVNQNSDGFDIKLPPNMTMAEFSECVKDLNNIFSRCPILQSKEEEVKLRGVDVGSMWLTFSVVCLTSATAFFIVHSIGALVDCVITILEHKAVLKQQEELCRATKMKNDLLEKIINTNNIVLDEMRQQAAESLAHSREIEDPAAIAELRGNIAMLEKWIDRGMQIYASIDAPKEAKAAFPPVERQSLPNAVVKALTGESGESAE